MMINALQHVGQGVFNATVTYDFYKSFFGYKVKLNDLTTLDEDMAPVVGSLETVRSLMAMNVRGGAILELIEHKSSPIRPYPQDGGYGDYGILEVGYDVRQIDDVISRFLARGIQFLSPVYEIPIAGGGLWHYAYLKDPDGLRLQLMEQLNPDIPVRRKPEVRGIVLLGIGVSNLDRSKEFYRSVLGFDTLLYEFEGHMSEMDRVSAGPLSTRLAILSRSAPVAAAINTLPAGIVKLLEIPGHKGKHIFKGRRWGDIGCVEFCMDVTDLDGTIEEIKAKGVSHTWLLCRLTWDLDPKEG